MFPRDLRDRFLAFDGFLDDLVAFLLGPATRFGIVPRTARMNWSAPPRCGRSAEASLKNAPHQQIFHNVLVQIEIHLSLLCALNRSNSKTVPNFEARDRSIRIHGRESWPS